MRNLWSDDAGFAYTTEALFAVTFAIFVAVIGGVALRNALISELSELANALLQLNQSYSFAGETNCKASVAGSSADDLGDYIGGRTVNASSGNIIDLVCD